MTSTLKERWNKLIGGRHAAAVEPAPENIDDTKADTSAAEHLGGIDPERLLEDDHPPA